MTCKIIRKEIVRKDMIGNNYGARYKTKDERVKVYKKFCDHVAKGYSLSCFPECAENTMRKMMQDYSNELNVDLLRNAIRTSMRMYEDMGIKGARGEIHNFNAKSWQFLIMNKNGWKLNESRSIVNVNVDADVEATSKIVAELKEKYKRDY